MKYTDSVEIALPRKRVVMLISDPELFPKWLCGLVLHEPLDGVHGQVGTKSRVVFQTGQQEMECTETITRREPADLHRLSYDDVVHFDREIVAEGMWNVTRDRFTEVGPEATLWESENEYRFSSLPMRLLSRFMRGAFRKQSRQHMQDFKAFAEQGIDIDERDQIASDGGDRRSVLVTGAATGIGLATAELLATDGWRVLGTALPDQDATDLRAVGAECIHVDLTDPSSQAKLTGAVTEMPRLDALVSNAGIAIPGPIEGLSTDDLDAHFQLNSMVPMQLAKAVLPQLRATQGRMVFMGAGQGRVALPFGGPYGASKSALAALTDALRAEIADTGVTVSLIEPGAVRTGILTSSRDRGLRLLDRLPAEAAQRYRDPMLATLEKSERAFQSALTPAEIAGLIQRILDVAQPKPRYLIGREAAALAVLAVLPARLRAPLVARLGRSQRSDDHAVPEDSSRRDVAE